jgi:hypothetical protein
VEQFKDGFTGLEVGHSVNTHVHKRPLVKVFDQVGNATQNALGHASQGGTIVILTGLVSELFERLDDRDDKAAKANRAERRGDGS